MQIRNVCIKADSARWTLLTLCRLGTLHLIKSLKLKFMIGENEINEEAQGGSVNSMTSKLLASYQIGMAEHLSEGHAWLTVCCKLGLKL